MAAGSIVGAGNNDDEFPLLCDSCLGPNPYIRMLKDVHGGKCQVCERAFTSFSWRPGGKGMRMKKTEICVPCARMKDLCQTCIHDLKFNLPAKVRDQSLAPGDRQLTVVPRSDGTREYTANQNAHALASGSIDAIYNGTSINNNNNSNIHLNGNAHASGAINGANGGGGGVVASTTSAAQQPAAPPKPRTINNTAERLARKKPNYKRNLAKICTFFLENRCKKGAYCPFRHERPDESRDKRLDDQNLRDRYYGTHDPVADNMLSRAAAGGAPRRGVGESRYGWEDRKSLGSSARGGPDERPGTPRSGDRPSTPRERPGTPRERPSTPRERPSTPRERPGTPSGGGEVGNGSPGGVGSGVGGESGSGPGGSANGSGGRGGVGERPNTPRQQLDDSGGRPSRQYGPRGPPPVPPADRDIKELYIGGQALNKKHATEADVRGLYVGCPGLANVSMKPGFAFAIFHTREQAELAMEKCHGEHTIAGFTAVVNWGAKSTKNKRVVDHRWGDNRPSKRGRAL